MQTFLPYPDFLHSANCLDWQYFHNRLNNQINEAIVIARVLLEDRENKWMRHPAVKMWDGYELALVDYATTCLLVWERKKEYSRTFRHGILIGLQGEAIAKAKFVKLDEIETPKWLGREDFHSAHRAILLAKLPSWYSQFGWTEKPAVRRSDGRWPYYWPVR